MGGIGRKMPFTMGAFGVASLSMIGVPLVCGFVTKWYIALGVLESRNHFFLLVLLASTILNTGYFIPVVFKAFFDRPGAALESSGPSDPAGLREAPAFMVVPLVLTALGSILFGLYPDYFLNIVKAVFQ